MKKYEKFKFILTGFLICISLFILLGVSKNYKPKYEIYEKQDIFLLNTYTGRCRILSADPKDPKTLYWSIIWKNGTELIKFNNNTIPSDKKVKWIREIEKYE